MTPTLYQLDEMLRHNGFQRFVDEVGAIVYKGELNGKVKIYMYQYREGNFNVWVMWTPKEGRSVGVEADKVTSSEAVSFVLDCLRKINANQLTAE